MTPLNGKLLVLREEKEKERVSTGGIVLPGSTEDKAPARGKVLEVASDITDVVVGNTIVFPKFAGIPVEFDDGVKLLVIDIKEVLLVV